MTTGENLRRAVCFETPEWIPMTFHINPACWRHYPPGFLEEGMERHPRLFSNADARLASAPVYLPFQRKDHPYTDPWGCVWTTSMDGITGSVTTHPLADWAALETYAWPDPALTDGMAPVDWGEITGALSAAREKGSLAMASLRHGHTFLQLCDLRGYENLMFDMADSDPRLDELIEKVAAFNEDLVRRYLKAGAEWISYPEDLGMQQGPMISPMLFRKYILPVYRRIMAPAQKADVIIHMHSDGDIRTLAKDLIEGGVKALNLQDLVNGIDWIAENLAGRVCIDLDIDRQKITRYGTPAQIDALIREEVEKLGHPTGGLTMIFGLYPGVPIENVDALMEAMERYADYYNN
jgi:hypothetical protein